VRIDGLFELKQKRKRLARAGTVTVSIGPACATSRAWTRIGIARDLERRMEALEIRRPGRKMTGCAGLENRRLSGHLSGPEFGRLIFVTRSRDRTIKVDL